MGVRVVEVRFEQARQHVPSLLTYCMYTVNDCCCETVIDHSWIFRSLQDAKCMSLNESRPRGNPQNMCTIQCARVATEFSYTHLSTGDLLRKEQTKNSDLAATIAECIK